MHYIRKYFLIFLTAVLTLTSCASQNSNTQNSNPIIPDHFDLPLNYKVKLNGTSKVTIKYMNPENELQEITIGLGDRGGFQTFEFKFDTPGDVHYISASVPETDTALTFLQVSTEHFTKIVTDENFVEISY